jgi:hypothetical protein
MQTPKKQSWAWARSKSFFSHILKNRNFQHNYYRAKQHKVL